MNGTEWCIFDTWDLGASPITETEQEARDAMAFAKALFGGSENWSDDRFQLMKREPGGSWEEAE